MSNDEPWYFDYDEFKHETEDAWLLDIMGDEIWLPKSLCDLDRDEMSVEMPQWLAVKKGLIEE